MGFLCAKRCCELEARLFLPGQFPKCPGDSLDDGWQDVGACTCQRSHSRDCVSSSINSHPLDAQAKPPLVARRKGAGLLFPARTVRPGK